MCREAALSKFDATATIGPRAGVRAFRAEFARPAIQWRNPTANQKSLFLRAVLARPAIKWTHYENSLSMKINNTKLLNFPLFILLEQVMHPFFFHPQDFQER